MWNAINQRFAVAITRLSLAVALLAASHAVQALVPLENVAAIATGVGHTCALTTAGGAKCWGSNGNGQLGDNSTTSRLTPVEVFGLTSGVAAIAGGGGHTCALTIGGGIKCWGSNSSGQLGDNSTTNRLTAVDVIGLTSGVAAIAAGDGYSCALTISGGAKCWGDNSYGQLGDNSTTQRLTPVDVFGLTSRVAAIAVRSTHTCALTTGGGVKCWGDNRYGQLGDNSITRHLTPVDVFGLTSGVAAITTGGTADRPAISGIGLPFAGAHTCALSTSGGIKCWGANQVGQLGDNSTTQRLAPADVVGLTSGITAITAGDAHTCALTSGGGAKCWGANQYEQVGNNPFVHRLTAMDVSGLASGVAAIAASGSAPPFVGSHTCALITGGGIKCWGANQVGQLGDGTVSTRIFPVDVLVPFNTPGALTGLWWNPNESGWGIHFTQRGSNIFAAWYTYDGSGNPKWYVASNCTGATGASGTCSGALYEVNGPTFFGTTFNPNAVNVVAAGSLQVNFQNANSASMTYTLGTQSRTVAIVRQPLGTGAIPGLDYTDLWWNPGESGWGMAIAQQAANMFLAWYVYDNTGKPVWYVASNCAVSGNGCTGTLYCTTGPPFGPTFNSAAVQVITVGTMTLAFSDASNGTLTYTVNGVSASKTITRQLF